MSIEHPAAGNEKPFRPIRLILVILLILLLISMAAQWYGEHVTMPRYCQYPAGVIQRVEQVLNEPQPAGDGDRKPYIIAARLMFLVPRQSNESQTDYIERLERHIEKQCR
ncbi:MAG: hypothetical protein KZQ77_18475 [Candidatus Thiodiazotropha sp. (ex Notomyrtea botanica)]|nr:hypothetical protein [Candidatus Thiodiazotropha sp. (ex Notomyrtea botanica)]